jgi:hypothetical protein
MVRTLAALLGSGLMLNGTAMIGIPLIWYAQVPGVAATGPFNPHFVRDIGCAFLVAGLGFVWGAARHEHARGPMIMGALFLALHALMHAWDLAAGREPLGHVLTDLPGIALPAVLAFWLALPKRSGQPPPPPSQKSARSRSRSKGLVSWLASHPIDAFERAYDNDASYLRQIAETSGAAFLRFGLFSVFAEQKQGAPTTALVVAKLCAVMNEDCGPCTQLVVRMGEDAGVARDDLLGVIRGEQTRMSSDATLAYGFARSVLARDLETSSHLRKEVVARWGDRALVSLAFAMSAARVYPTLKYALGHGSACARVTVSGQMIELGAAGSAMGTEATP